MRPPASRTAVTARSSARALASSLISLIHIIGQLCGTFKREGLEQPAILITDFDLIPSRSSYAPPTPMSTPPRPSRLKFGPTGSPNSPTTQAVSVSPSHNNNYPPSESVSVSTSDLSIDSTELANGTMSNSEDGSPSLKRRRFLSSKAKSSE
jgi:hypothetical protein